MKMARYLGVRKRYITSKRVTARWKLLITRQCDIRRFKENIGFPLQRKNLSLMQLAPNFKELDKVGLAASDQSLANQLY